MAASSNVDALDRTLGVLRDLGRLTPLDDARVTAVRLIAAALDSGGCVKCGDPSQNAALWRQYREALGDLLEVDDDVDDDLDAALEEIRGGSEVGDTET